MSRRIMINAALWHSLGVELEHAQQMWDEGEPFLAKASLETAMAYYKDLKDQEEYVPHPRYDELEGLGGK